MNKLLLTLTSCAIAVSAHAQQALTASDYARAESYLGYNTERLVDYNGVRPNWLAGDSFWYRNLTPQGSEFMVVNAAKGTRTAAFDQAKLAAALSTANGHTYDANMLPFQSFTYTPDGKSIIFQAEGKQWKTDLITYQVTADTSHVAGQAARSFRGRSGNEVLSPDGKLAAFIKDYNLWLRDVKTKKLTQLTTDGVKDFGYATDNAGWTSSDSPILLWSPDSKKIATNKQDERTVGNMYLYTTNVGHPTLRAWKYPLPGDKTIATIQHVIIDVTVPKVLVLQVPPDAHRSTFSDDIYEIENYFSRRGQNRRAPWGRSWRIFFKPGAEKNIIYNFLMMTFFTRKRKQKFLQ